MAKVTYNPKHPNDPQETEWDGRAFKAGKAIELDGRQKSHKDFIERARLNPWFDVDGENGASDKPAGEPKTVEEYRAYAAEWIGKAKSANELEKRWKAEQPMRQDLGWGTDDQALLDPILVPRIDNLKAAES